VSVRSIPQSANEDLIAPACWQCGRWRLSLQRPLIMGIVNVTPDSFSDGGRFLQFDRALEHARQLIAEGADLLDIGCESTRPGAAEVSAAQEIERVLPVVRALRESGVPLSVDTSKPELMRAALDEGAAVINDVRALAAPGAVELVAQRDCGVVLMHMQGTPQTMQADPSYMNVVDEVGDFLRQRRDALLQAGVAPERIVLDPGFGFGKRGAHNRRLLARLGELRALGQPLLVGLSRKAALGEMTGRPVDQRLVASVVAALLAIQAGALIVRVHDVAATRDAIAVWDAVRREQQ
jgi:dihydropteroate synthase